jgi:hypothetical protein
MKYFARLAALVFTGAAMVLPLVAVAAGLDQLDRFAGTWTSPGVLVDTPYSKAASVSATTSCAWSSERLFNDLPTKRLEWRKDRSRPRYIYL